MPRLASQPLALPRGVQGGDLAEGGVARLQPGGAGSPARGVVAQDMAAAVGHTGHGGLPRPVVRHRPAAPARLDHPVDAARGVVAPALLPAVGQGN